MQKKRPDFSNEKHLWEKGYSFVCGVDEVGRGSWAGPIVAAGVVFQKRLKRNPGINDSKRLSQKQRETIAQKIIQLAHDWGVGVVSSKELDKIGTTKANILAMKRAVQNLAKKPDYILVDGTVFWGSKTLKNFSNIIRGDQKSISIAAASIIAKVYRDRLMVNISKNQEKYGFERHKGYGTKSHKNAIIKNGLLDIHRRTFAPIKEILT